MHPRVNVPVYQYFYIFTTCAIVICESVRLVPCLLSRNEPSWDVYDFQVGLSAPQGCGKTTVVESLEYLFTESGKYVFVFTHTSDTVHPPSAWISSMLFVWPSRNLIECNTIKGMYCACVLWVKTSSCMLYILSLGSLTALCYSRFMQSSCRDLHRWLLSQSRWSGTEFLSPIFPHV